MGSAITERCLQALLSRHGQGALLANVLTRTSRMLVAAQSGDWALVTAMENKRSQLIKQCFSEPVSEENNALFSEALAIMLHMNEELVALLEAAKANAAVRHKGDKGVHEAIAHYLDAKTGYL